MSNLTEMRLSDGGDGSTYIELKFDDGKVLNFNPDIPYDGTLVLTWSPDQAVWNQDTHYYCEEHDKDFPEEHFSKDGCKRLQY